MGEAGSSPARRSASLAGRPARDAEGAVNFALGLLRARLRPDLAYHNLWHTEQDVMPAAAKLAELAALDSDAVELLRVAAAFHDLGFIVRAAEHEQLGADLAAEHLPGFGFAPAEINAIRGMIMATRLPQSPRTPSEEILADADLDVLGRDDFLPRNRALRDELASLGRSFTDSQWLSSQLGFVAGHRYFNPHARALRDDGKARNVGELQRRLAVAH